MFGDRRELASVFAKPTSRTVACGREEHRLRFSWFYFLLFWDSSVSRLAILSSDSRSTFWISAKVVV